MRNFLRYSVIGIVTLGVISSALWDGIKWTVQRAAETRSSGAPAAVQGRAPTVSSADHHLSGPGDFHLNTGTADFRLNTDKFDYGPYRLDENPFDYRPYTLTKDGFDYKSEPGVKLSPVTTEIRELTAAESGNCIVRRGVPAAIAGELTTFTLPLLVGGGTYSGPVMVTVWLPEDQARVWRTTTKVQACGSDRIQYEIAAEGGVIVVPGKRSGYTDIELLVAGNRLNFVVSEDIKAMALRSN